MKNKRGQTALERITKDIEFAETVTNTDQRRLLAHMAIAAAELAVDFGMITRREWTQLIDRAFVII